jgi:hypothetical protein
MKPHGMVEAGHLHIGENALAMRQQRGVQQGHVGDEGQQRAVRSGIVGQGPARFQPNMIHRSAGRAISQIAEGAPAQHRACLKRAFAPHPGTNGGGKAGIAQQLLLIVFQTFRLGHHRHLGLMLKTGLGLLKRRCQGENLCAMLDGDHPSGGEAASIP